MVSNLLTLAQALCSPGLEWLGPIPHDGGDKPAWVPEHAIVMLAWNPREYQNGMTWEFAAKRKAAAKERDWQNATAFCIETPIHTLPPAAMQGERDAIVHWLAEDAAKCADELRKLHAGKKLTPRMTIEWEDMIAARSGIAAAIARGEHLKVSPAPGVSHAQAHTEAALRAVGCPLSPNGSHQVDTSMESGPDNCFYCEQPMPRSAVRTSQAGKSPASEA